MALIGFGGPVQAGTLCWACVLCSGDSQACAQVLGRAFWCQADVASSLGNGIWGRGTPALSCHNNTAAKDLFIVDQILPPLLEPSSTVSRPVPGLKKALSHAGHLHILPYSHVQLFV